MITLTMFLLSPRELYFLANSRALPLFGVSFFDFIFAACYTCKGEMWHWR